MEEAGGSKALGSDADCKCRAKLSRSRDTPLKSLLGRLGLAADGALKPAPSFARRNTGFGETVDLAVRVAVDGGIGLRMPSLGAWDGEALEFIALDLPRAVILPRFGVSGIVFADDIVAVLGERGEATCPCELIGLGSIGRVD